jgi:hypothetical protein
VSESFVPEAFIVPVPLVTPTFGLDPLGPQHHEQDYEAWTTSIDHILATPGFAGRGWPHPMAPEANRQDLLRHEQDFAARKGFTYAVFSEDVYVGCVYLYPGRSQDYDVDVLSWVRAERAELDRPLHQAITAWLASSWPWHRPDYAAR